MHLWLRSSMQKNTNICCFQLLKCGDLLFFSVLYNCKLSLGLDKTSHFEQVTLDSINLLFYCPKIIYYLKKIISIIRIWSKSNKWCVAAGHTSSKILHSFRRFSLLTQLCHQYHICHQHNCPLTRACFKRWYGILHQLCVKRFIMIYCNSPTRITCLGIRGSST